MSHKIRSNGAVNVLIENRESRTQFQPDRDRSTYLSAMPEVLNPDIQTALQAAIAFLADTVTAGEGEISVPLSGAYLNGFVFSCGRARLVVQGDTIDSSTGSQPSSQADHKKNNIDRTLEVTLLGAHRDSAWRHSWSATAVSLPDDCSAGSPDLLRRLNFSLQELLNDTVTTRFAHRWDPDWLEGLSGLGQEIGLTRGFLEVLGDTANDAELDGHLFRRVAGHWVWIGRAG